MSLPSIIIISETATEVVVVEVAPPGGGGDGGGSVTWSEVSGKPTTFAPSAHGHTWSEITEKPTTFAPSAHGHTWSEITEKPTTFDPSAHGHASADITDANAVPTVGKAALWGQEFIKSFTLFTNAYVLQPRNIVNGGITFLNAANNYQVRQVSGGDWAIWDLDTDLLVTAGAVGETDLLLAFDGDISTVVYWPMIGPLTLPVGYDEISFPATTEREDGKISGVATIVEKDNDTAMTLTEAFSCNAGPVILLYTSGGDVNLTTDPTAPVGTVWYLTPDNSGDITIVAAGGTTRHFEDGAGPTTNGQGSMIMVVHRAQNQFLIVGGVA